jgi:hypothetical protein
MRMRFCCYENEVLFCCYEDEVLFCCYEDGILLLVVPPSASLSATSREQISGQNVATTGDAEAK